MNTQLHHLLVRQRQAELANQAERARQVRNGVREHEGLTTPDRQVDIAITLRLAGAADAAAISDLADLDSAAIPAEPVLIAEASGRVRAAVSLRDGAIIADPFHHTVAVRQLLLARAAQLRGDRKRGRRLFGRKGTATRPHPTKPSAAMGVPTGNHAAD
jgi:hypothetical protein